jgi:starch synthase
MRYGSIPVVRATGGLADTVQPYDPNDSTGTGFVFQDPTADALGEAIGGAIDLYHQARRWRRLMCASMETDFSWKRAANEYVEVYETAREKVRDRQPEAAG